MKQILFLLLLWAGHSPAHAVSQASDPFSSPAPAGKAVQQQQFLPVERAYQSLLSWDKEALLLQWTIADGYYLYRERFALSATLNGEPLTLTPHYQDGEIKDDPYFGRTEVYYYNTELSLTGLPRDQAFRLSVTSQGCADAGLCYPPQTQHYRFDPEADRFEQLSNASATNVKSAPDTSGSLWLMLLFAALGGAILNLMPCVFPVLSLKVLSFANAGEGRAGAHGLAYSVGVVLSFIAVAALLIALQQAGQAVGWGFQLQSPAFVAALATLFFLLSLNLFGLFDIAGRWMNAGGQLSQRSGYKGSFFTGVLATLVASPCTAPFMGTAVGFAVSQSATVALLVFASLGAGMALPVLLLSLFPQWLKRLPKPGPWMARLRQLLAFPLLASAIWLLWVMGRQQGTNAMAALLLAWLLLTFALWLWRLGRAAKILSTVSVAAAVMTTLAGLQATPNTPAERFDRSQIDALRSAGHNVFLDVTADWCITCAANERLVLHTDRIQTAFAANNVRYLVADWTRYDPAITKLLEDYQRNGIPLYVYYPADPRQNPTVLPQILSKSLVLGLFPTQK